MTLSPPTPSTYQRFVVFPLNIRRGNLSTSVSYVVIVVRVVFVVFLSFSYPLSVVRNTSCLVCSILFPSSLFLSLIEILMLFSSLQCMDLV